MATQRRYSIEFKRQVVHEYQAGETLHGLAKRHGISRSLVRIWPAKAEAGKFDDDLAAASILQEYESAYRRAGATGRQARPRERVSKGGFAARSPADKRDLSVVSGPMVSRSPKDAD
ncbi:MAG: transposase [Hyphomonadaceae bacterium]|nr:transposase [Hyphomonadaceae bacterium]